jgi:hypothetical protein
VLVRAIAYVNPHGTLTRPIRTEDEQLPPQLRRGAYGGWGDVGRRQLRAYPDDRFSPWENTPSLGEILSRYDPIRRRPEVVVPPFPQKGGEACHRLL